MATLNTDAWAGANTDFVNLNSPMSIMFTFGGWILLKVMVIAPCDLPSAQSLISTTYLGNTPYNFLYHLDRLYFLRRLLARHVNQRLSIHGYQLIAGAK